MGSKRVLFKEADITRAVKGASKGGLDVGRVEIDASGRIIIMAKGVSESAVSELDKWTAKHANKA